MANRHKSGAEAEVVYALALFVYTKNSSARGHASFKTPFKISAEKAHRYIVWQREQAKLAVQ